MSKPPIAPRKPFWPKRRAPPPPPGARAEPIGFRDVRLSLLDDLEATAFFFQEAAGGSHARRDPVKVLALSGGGAGGAFGAGALVGLSRAGARPTFDLVTGVSTGALIAPFALLGSAWDERLQDAYTGGYAAELLGLMAVRPGVSLYPAERLEALVGRYVDAEMIEAVAAAHRAGRRLFVATANLDAQTTSIWDMGGIAARGGPEALRLFADILIASASVPGVFPPKLLRVEADGTSYDELHVDGGAISPLFVVPEPLILRRAREHASGGAEVYVLVNTTLEPTPRPTPLGAVPVLVRSFELMLRSSYRSAVRSVAAFCQLNDFPLHSASIPADGDGANMLRFDREAMTRLFLHGAEIAESGRLWRRSQPL
ncbi:patatin-like phospholipase family protein [Phenylobacterium sp. VNQ135]|uniref:patatin-like phospholipase family protein n=1 Tax=Phenylobacterium sp. VNQ135 TaxID=3400922 RepID=UPI003C0A9854